MQENLNNNEQKCAIKYTMHVVGGKWKTMLLYQMFINETRRYGELKKSLMGITHKMLSQHLKELENDGLILRKEYCQIPPKVEYSLTQKGETLIPVLKIMSDWGEAHMG